MDCSIIIPNYNGRGVLNECLASLYQATASHPVEREIIVVDNGSSDESVRLVREDYPAVKLLSLPRNTGFTGGINAGVQSATGRILFFLNNDAAVDFDWQDQMLETIRDPAISAVSSLMLDASGDKIDYGGGTANLFGWGFQSHHGEATDILGEESAVVPQLFCCGGAMAVKRDVYDKVGGFDGDYFAFFEDVDLGWRMNLAGFKCVLNPKARVFHQQSWTAKQMPKNLRAFLTERNALATMVKNLSDANLAELMPWGIGLMLERGLLDLGIERDKFFAGRWGDEVFNRHVKKGQEILIDEVVELRESSKRIVKEALLREGNQGERGQARLLAMEAVLTELPKWLAKRATVQALRTVGDKQIMPLMKDLLRPPLGHPREQSVITALSEWLAKK